MILFLGMLSAISTYFIMSSLVSLTINSFNSIYNQFVVSYNILLKIPLFSEGMTDKNFKLDKMYTKENTYKEYIYLILGCILVIFHAINYSDYFIGFLLGILSSIIIFIVYFIYTNQKHIKFMTEALNAYIEAIDIFKDFNSLMYSLNIEKINKKIDDFNKTFEKDIFQNTKICYISLHKIILYKNIMILISVAAISIIISVI